MSAETWTCPQLNVLRSDGSSVQTNGEIQFEPTGKVELVLLVTGAHHLGEFQEQQDITGRTAEGLNVVAVGAYATHARFESSTGISRITFVPLECRLTRPDAIKWDRREIYLKSFRIDGLCKITNDSTDFTFRPLPNLDDKRPGIVRAVMVVEPAGVFSDSDHLPVLFALSLAQRCMIQSPLQKSFDGDLPVDIRLVPNEMPSKATNPLVPQTPAEMATYLDQVLPAFLAQDGDLQLHRLIQYYCLSVAAPYGEVKFILASVLMEAFKFYWALNVGKKPAVPKANGLIRGFQKATNKHGKPVLYGFEDLLVEACGSLGYHPTFTFIEDRNALFHSGAPGAHQPGATSTWAAIKPELVQLYRQIDDILLRVLGYQGPVLRWDNPDMREAFP